MWFSSMPYLLYVPLIIPDNLGWMSVAYMVGKKNYFCELSFDLHRYTKPHTYKHTKNRKNIKILTVLFLYL